MQVETNSIIQNINFLHFNDNYDILNEYNANEKTYDNDLKKNKKKSKKDIYGKGSEAKMIKEELGNFNIYQSEAYNQIVKNFGKSIRLCELLGIVNSIKCYLQSKKNEVLPNISRNEKRSFQLLVKYIENNKNQILPYFKYITLCDSSFEKIEVDN